MRTTGVLAFLTALATAATPALAANHEAADKSLGTALMSAYVEANGTLNPDWGSGAVSAARQGTGIYVVTFSRNVIGCVMTATVWGDGTANVISDYGSGNAFIFTTRDVNGMMADRAINVIAVCAR